MHVMRALTAGLVLGYGLLAAQEPQTPRFRVAVDAVRIDAVVSDKDGHVVRDLTADDFDIYQDGTKQKVTFAQFVPVLASPAGETTPSNPSPRTSAVVGAPPPRNAGAVRRESIQRTLAIVIDDLGMSIESLYYVKRGLHDFIDHSLQPGDLVALVRTGGSIEGLQPFTTDRRVLHAAVDNLKWNAFSGTGVEAFAAVNQYQVRDSHAPVGVDASDFTSLDAARHETMAAGALSAVNLIIQGAKNLPGRKALLFVSQGFRVLESSGGARTADNPVGIGQPLPDPRVRAALDKAVDEATRAGVVVYSIDARGLQTGALLASDNLKVPIGRRGSGKLRRPLAFGSDGTG